MLMIYIIFHVSLVQIVYVHISVPANKNLIFFCVDKYSHNFFIYNFFTHIFKYSKMVYTVSDVRVTIPRTVRIVVIADGICEIPNEYFVDCHELKHIILPDSIQIIGEFAFHNCRKLEMITLPKDVRSIGMCCFQNCVNLKTMYLPGSLQNLRFGAFKGCSDLQYINLPHKLHRVESSLFSHCFSLKSITIPSNIARLGKECFLECRSLRSICFTERSSKQEKPIEIEKGVFGLCKNLLQIDLTNSGSYSIGESCFAFCHNLRHVKLPWQMNEIEQRAFRECQSLTYVGYDDLPGNVCLWDDNKFEIDLPRVKYISYQAFEGCSKLESVKLYQKQYILPYAFRDCTKLSEVSLPSYLKLQNDYCNIFSNTRNIVNLEIRCKAKDISNNIAFHVMYEIVNLNKKLMYKPVTVDGYRPFEVLIWALASEDDYRPPGLTVTRVLDEFLREDPSQIKIFLNPENYFNR